MSDSILALVQNSRLWAAPQLPFLPTQQAATQLAAYIELLLAWNRKLNLTGCADPRLLMADLIQDSFFLVRFLEDVFSDYAARMRLRICDLGAGAGLPGVPLRILWPHGQYLWIERGQRRALFLANVNARLRLGMQGLCASAQSWFGGGELVDCIVSRAFMSWRKLLDLCASGLAQAGAVIIMANSAPPALPAPWRLAASLAYAPCGKQRWLWAARRADQ